MMKRVLEEKDDYIDSEDDDEENEYIDSEDDDGQDDMASESDGEDLSRQAEKDVPNQVENEIEVTCDGSLVNRRFGRARQTKKVKDVNSLYD